MRTGTRLVAAAGGLSLALMGHTVPAPAYQSVCNVQETTAGESRPCEDGPEVPRHRWRGPLAEHANLFEHGATLAGWPAAASTDLELTVFTDAFTVELSGTPSPTYRPADFATLTRATTRSQGIADFAQLPDFSYALFDWALGNETCPLDEVSDTPIEVKACHAFRRHMGAANSNHFLPQARHFYRYYHSLALDRAQRCKRLGTMLPVGSDRFLAYRVECEKLAFVLEAVAHHFLQDAWSSGHMWERWGSPDPRDYENLATGLAVALSSGIIHGVRAVTTALEDSQLVPVQEVNDTMCAPHPQVEWLDTGGTPALGVGDLYAESLMTEPAFEDQRSVLLACTVASMRELYLALGDSPAHGPLGPVGSGGPSASMLASIDPGGAQCFGQRATNRAIARGAGVDFIDTSGQQRWIPLRWIAPRLVPIASEVFGGSGAPLDWASLQVRYRRDILRIAANITHRGATAPFDTDLAEGTMGRLLNVGPNSEYVNEQQLAPYLDPPAPWLPAGGSDVNTKTSALALTFHRANAEELCDRVQQGDPEFDLNLLRERVAAEPDDSATRTALCTACAEMVSRHVRYGTGPGNYLANHEPLCHYLTDAQSQFVYVDAPLTTPESETAWTWCGCEAGADAAEPAANGSATITSRYSGVVARTYTDLDVNGERECDQPKSDNFDAFGAWSGSVNASCDVESDSGVHAANQANAQQSSEVFSGEDSANPNVLFEAGGTASAKADVLVRPSSGNYHQGINNLLILEFEVHGGPVVLDYHIALGQQIHTYDTVEAKLVKDGNETIFGGKIWWAYPNPIDTTHSVSLEPGAYKFIIQMLSQGGGDDLEWSFEMKASAP